MSHFTSRLATLAAGSLLVAGGLALAQTTGQGSDQPTSAQSQGNSNTGNHVGTPSPNPAGNAGTGTMGGGTTGTSTGSMGTGSSAGSSTSNAAMGGSTSTGTSNPAPSSTGSGMNPAGSIGNTNADGRLDARPDRN